MSSWVNRVVGKVVALRSGEASVALLMFAYSFLAMTSYNILKPLTRSKFITALGSDNLPYVQLVAGILIGLLMHAYSHAIRRVPRRYVIPLTQAVIVGLLVVFWGLLRTGEAWVTVAFYFLGLVLGILLISQFWTLANDVYDARQAKRLFGFIGGGASLGGALGAAITAIVVEEVGSDNLLLVAAVVLGACILIVLAIGKRLAAGDGADFAADERGVGGAEAVRLLGESRHLRVIALVIAFAAAGAAIVEQQLNMAAEATRGAEGVDAITAFLAQVTFFVSIAGFVVQVALTSRIHRSLGLAFALLLLPVSLGTTAAVILVTGALWAPAVARVMDSTLRYTVDKTTREVLFLPLPTALKYSAKPFIDVTMDRFAKAAAALLILVLIKPWGLGLDWRRLSLASLVMTGAWIVMALVARRDYLASFRESIGARTIVPDAVRTDVSDAATVETLVEELSNPNELAVLYAIDMLEAIDKRNLITPLLLHHESARVRSRTLLALASSTRSRVAVRWVSAVERMMRDEDVDVRAAALRALAALSQEDAPSVMRRHLDDPEPRVVVAAASLLADSDRAADVDAAEHTLKRLIADTREATAEGRKEVATALAHIRAARFRSLLVPLLHDHQTAVVQEAIKSARVMGASDGLFLPGLISLLGHRALKAEARETLVSYGEDAIDALAYFLRDEHEFIWIRRHVPATLASMPTQKSMDALIACLGDRDGFLRYKAIAAIEHLRRHHPKLSCPPAVIEKLVVRETSQYYNFLTLRYNLFEHDTSSRGSLLDRALGDKLERTLDRIYRLLGLLYHVDDVAAARYTIERGEARRRAAAVEYLDNLLGGVVRKRVLPILDETPIAEKVRHANLVLKSRPRDLEDTLAQLVHEDDPVVAAAAIHFVARRRLWTLADDLKYILDRRSEDRSVVEAASWALALRANGAAARALVTDALPAVELADRVRSIPIFEFVSVDELFRIAEVGQESRHPAGQDLYRSGAAIDEVELLIEGAVESADAAGEVREHRSPHVLGLEELLQGAPLDHSIRALDHVVSFRIRGADFMTMVSDNVLLAQGLFRMLLDGSAGVRSRTAPVGTPYAGSLNGRGLPLQPVDRALLLREHPLLARATATQLLALVGAAQEIPLVSGHVVFEAVEPAALYLILEGSLLLGADGGETSLVATGVTIGVAETLAGTPAGRRATVTRNGRAIRLDRDELFAVLTDHMDLMQGLFSGVLALRAKEAVSGNALPGEAPTFV